MNKTNVSFLLLDFSPLGQKKKCYIGVTRPTVKLGPTLHFFLNQKKSYFGSKNVNFGVWDLVGSLKCMFLYVFHIPAWNLNFAKNVTTLLHWADDMKCLIDSVKNSSSKKKKKNPYLPTLFLFSPLRQYNNFLFLALLCICTTFCCPFSFSWFRHKLNIVICMHFPPSPGKYTLTCDVIKPNQSEVGNISFEIQPKRRK